MLERTDDRAGNRARRIAFVVTALVCVVLDQVTKAWAWSNLRGEPPKVIADGLLALDYGFNPGSAFGFLADSADARWVFIPTTLIALAYMVWLVRRMPVAAGTGFVALGMMSGGALGNLIDRLVRVDSVHVRFHQSMRFDWLLDEPIRIAEAIGRGRAWAEFPRHGVIDFIVVDLGGARAWPAFNLADTSLVIGVVLFVLTLLRYGGELTGVANPPRARDAIA